MIRHGDQFWRQAVEWNFCWVCPAPKQGNEVLGSDHLSHIIASKILVCQASECRVADSIRFDHPPVKFWCKGPGICNIELAPMDEDIAASQAFRRHCAEIDGVSICGLAAVYTS